MEAKGIKAFVTPRVDLNGSETSTSNVGMMIVRGVEERLRNGPDSRSSSFLKPSMTPRTVTQPTPGRPAVSDLFHGALRKMDISTFPASPSTSPQRRSNSLR